MKNDIINKFFSVDKSATFFDGLDKTHALEAFYQPKKSGKGLFQLRRI